MSKITPLDDVTNLSNEGSATSVINTNSDRIEEAIEETLSRTGEAPNQMEAVLDMNSNQIINLPDATTDSEPLTRGQGEDFLLEVFDANKASLKGDQGDPGADGADGADGIVASVQAGANITVNNTDPANPIVSASVTAGVNSVSGGSGITVGGTATDPVINLSTPVDADTLDGEDSSDFHDAAQLTGTIPDARLPAQVALTDEANSFTAGQATTRVDQNPSGGNLTLGAAGGNFFKSTIASATTVNLPSGLANGQQITLLLRFTATATVTFGGNWKLAGQAGNFEINGANTNVWLVSAIYDSSAALLYGCATQVV